MQGQIRVSIFGTLKAFIRALSVGMTDEVRTTAARNLGVKLMVRCWRNRIDDIGSRGNGWYK
jgi:hypothetical protein